MIKDQNNNKQGEEAATKRGRETASFKKQFKEECWIPNSLGHPHISSQTANPPTKTRPNTTAQ